MSFQELRQPKSPSWKASNSFSSDHCISIPWLVHGDNCLSWAYLYVFGFLFVYFIHHSYRFGREGFKKWTSGAILIGGQRSLLLLLLIYVAFLASFSTLFYTLTESILSRALRTQYANREISRRGPWVLLDVSFCLFILSLCHSVLLEVRQSKSNSRGYSSTKPWEAFVGHLKTFNLWSMGSHWTILYKVVTSDSCIVRKDRMIAAVWKVGCEAKWDSGQVGPKENQYDAPVEKSKSQWWQKVICSIGYSFSI